MGTQLSLKFHIAHAHLGMPDQFGTINSRRSLAQILNDTVLFFF